jgi:hypothetical protein
VVTQSEPKVQRTGQGYGRAIRVGGMVACPRITRTIKEARCTQWFVDQ